MKKSILLLASLIFFSLTMFGQIEGSHKQDTTKIKIGKRTLIIIQDEENNKEIKIAENEEIKNEDYDIIIDDKDANEMEEMGELDDLEGYEVPEVMDDYEIEEMEIEHPDGIRDKEIKIKKKAHKDHYKAKNYSRWAGWNLGFNKIIELDGYTRLDGNEEIWDNKVWKSRTWNLNILELSLSVIKKHFLITSGLGFEWRNYSFNKDFDLNYDENDNIYPVNSDTDYSKNKLKATYVQVPLLMEFNTSSKPKKGLYLGAGLIGGFRICSELLQEYDMGKQEIEKDIDDDFNLNDFQLIGTLRLGINRITLIANMDLMPIFESDKVFY